MTQFSIHDEGWRELIDALRAAGDVYSDAFDAALYQQGEHVMDLLQEQIWFDTGALADSAFVTKPAMIGGYPEVIVGFVAPYAAIVEFVHPRRPFLIRRIWIKEQGNVLDNVARFTEINAVAKIGVDDVSVKYPEQGEYLGDRVSGKDRSRKWGRAAGKKLKPKRRRKPDVVKTEILKPKKAKKAKKKKTTTRRKR